MKSRTNPRMRRRVKSTHPCEREVEFGAKNKEARWQEKLARERINPTPRWEAFEEDEA
jgi:hypothetical protein